MDHQWRLYISLQCMPILVMEKEASASIFTSVKNIYKWVDRLKTDLFMINEWATAGVLE